ncbi:MAG: DUF805 domain-containing protein [Alphaproteobacteria bacterium]|nr:DUF805 domain-containing protein [Alphaproteobacteria bacterium]
MVSKITVSETKKVSKSAAAKKASAKKIPVKQVPTALQEPPVLDQQIPVKENINPVDQVLEIKAHNEEKKVVKATRKMPKAVRSQSKGKINPKQAMRSRDTALAVKSAAQQATAKKQAAVKNHPDNKPQYAFDTPKIGVWAAWVRAYKNIFNFKGRTSRYEFWAFMLINLFAVCIFTVIPVLLTAITGSQTLGLFCVLAFLLLEVIIYLSAIVRRIHDTGCSAWKGNFRPFVWFSLIMLLALLGFALGISKNFDFAGTMPKHDVMLVFYYFGIFVLATSPFWLPIVYYSTKIGITSFYYEAEPQDNDYGKLYFSGSEFKAKGLKYTVLFSVCFYLLYCLAGVLSEYSY